MSTSLPSTNPEAVGPVHPVVKIVALADVIGWRIALLALSAERFQPLFARLGVPLHMAAQPAQLTTAAQRFCSVLLALSPHGTQGESDYCQAVQAMIQDFFAALHSAYPAHEVQALHGWALRQMVDVEQRNCWLVWAQLLRRVCWPGNPGIPLPGELADEVQEMVSKHFTRVLQDEDTARLTQARQSLPSALERTIVAREPTLGELLEGTLEETLTSERAYIIWEALHRRFLENDNPNKRHTDRERELRSLLLRWGREQATAMHIPAHLVTLPHSDG